MRRAALFACVLRDSMKVSCMVMAAREEEEPSLTDALTRVTQPRCLRSEKHVCSPILLTQTQQGHCAATLRAGLGPPGSASLSFCGQLTPLLSNVPQRDPPATASLPSVTSLCGEVLQVGCSCLQSQEGALRSRMWVACVCESLLCVLRAGISWMSDSLVLSRIGKLTNIWPWFFLPSGTQGTLG